METNVTGGGNTTITEVTKTENIANLEGFNLEGLGVEKLDSPEAIEAKRIADEAAIESTRLAAEEEAKRVASESTNKETFFEFEDKKFKLDENGNALNEDGTVFKTKEELDTIASSNTDDDNGTTLPLIEEIIQLNGIQILDDKGQPKVYEDSVQGVIEYSKDVAKFEAENSQKEFFNRLPQVKEFAQHLINGGKEEDFYKAKTASWKNFTLDITNENQLIEVITQDLIAKGQSKEEAAEIVQLYKDSNKLEEKGKVAVESRKKAEDVVNVEKAKKAEQEVIDNQVKIENYWKGIETTVKTGKLQNIIIPESDKGAFFDYVAKAVDKNGNSQYDLDEMTSKPEDDLQYKYLRFKKFDLSKLVKSQVATDKAKSLRDRIKKEQTGTNNGGGETTKEIVNPNDVEISLKSVFGA